MIRTGDGIELAAALRSAGCTVHEPEDLDEAFIDRRSTQKVLDKYPPETCPLCGGCCDAVPEDEDLFFVCEDCRTEFSSQMVELVGKHIVRRARR